jgi:hypothetical protein
LIRSAEPTACTGTNKEQIARRASNLWKFRARRPVHTRPRGELYDSYPSAQRRSATMSFQAGLGHGSCAKLKRLKTERNAAFRASGGRDLVPVKRDAIEDELAAPGMRLKVL